MKKFAILSFILLICLVTLLGSVFSARIDPTAEVATLAVDQYEIEISGDIWGGFVGHDGNLVKPTHRQSYWIYTQKLTGEIGAAEIILTSEKGKTEYPWPQSNLTGTIRFLENKLLVNLQRPIYSQSGSIQCYQDFLLNGKYLISRIVKCNE